MFHPSLTSSPFPLNQEDPNEKATTQHNVVFSLNIDCYTYEKRECISHREHFNMNESFAVIIRKIYRLNQNDLHCANELELTM